MIFKQYLKRKKMAFDKNTLKNDLIQILTNPKTQNNAEAVAGALADAIDKYVKTGKATGTDSRGDTHNLNLQ